MNEDDYVDLAGRINRGDMAIGILPLSAAPEVVEGLSRSGSARAWRELGRCYLGASGDVLPPAPWSPDLPFPDPADHPHDRALRCFAEAATLGDHEGALLFARCAREASVAAKEAALARLRPHARTDGATAYQFGLLEQWLDRPGSAVEHHLWAAARNDGDAAFELYVLFATGTGVERDDAEAARWLQRAADLGQDRALYNLGAAHATGNGAPLDPALAVRYYERAAEAGNARAAATAGVMYLMGEGVDEDRSRAAHWLDEAEDLGHPVDEWLAQLGLSRP
ncbi:tetratricopeptide repeat protein [Dactylosporangium sp. NPDC051541]|uniref:tetratricopeptide repeat protein n=1 Tax=Dactylosporangium sp. NPDC051541 TaxID=3363977 RepID=UPI0037B8B0A1